MIKTDIIIPTWEGNVKNELKNSLNSILGEITFINKIFLVIDGCKKFPVNLSISNSLKNKIIIIYLYKNYGPGYARNIGVFFSKAENIIFLDNGDKCSKNRIKTQINTLNEYEISVGHIKEIKKNRKASIRFSAKNIINAKRLLPYRTPFNNVTIAIKRKNFLELKGYPKLRTAEDWLFMGKVIKNNLKLFCENIVLVEIEKDELFISRRRGKHVLKDINFCINELKEMGLLNNYEKFISINIQKILRLYTPNKILEILFFLLRKNIK